jgi:uncharacterized protein YbdZ (MbtH family)
MLRHPVVFIVEIHIYVRIPVFIEPVDVFLAAAGSFDFSEPIVCPPFVPIPRNRGAFTDETRRWNGLPVGDSVSDYASTCIVIADTEQEAIERAKSYIPQGWHFTIEETVPDILAYFQQYPHSNMSVYGRTDQLR